MNQPILRSRPTPVNGNHPAQSPIAATATEAHDLEMRWATTVSQAKNALPPDYRQNPGAILLADQWARRRGIDTLTAMQNVSFVGGKPVVDATFQRAMAKSAGYEVDIEVDDHGEWAKCSVTLPNGKVKAALYSKADAHTAGLAGKDNWKKNPEDMLVARATTRCLRRHAPDVLLGVSLADELEEDAVDVLSPPHAATGGDLSEPVESELEPVDVDADVDVEIVDAEIVSDDLPASGEPAEASTEVEFKAELKRLKVTQGDAVRLAIELCPDCDPPGSVADLVAMPELAARVLADLDSERPF